MTQNLRDVLEILRFELNYIEQGGFDRDRALLGSDSPFEGTIACINFGNPLQAHACHECFLYQFVPDDRKTEKFPCHYIQLNVEGETIAELAGKNDPQHMALALKHWLRVTIEQMEGTLSRSSEP